MLSLSVIIISSILASIALFFLMRSSLPDDKKQNILLIMGVLIFLSIAISNFKTREISFPFFSTDAQSKLRSIFLKQMPPYSNKYDIDSESISNKLAVRNYANYEDPIKDYSEALVFISDKNEGASYFMFQLAQKLRSQSLPVIYVKFESEVSCSKQFFRKTDLISYEHFKHALAQYLSQNIKPYVIIDNVECLPFPVLDILEKFDDSHSPHMIFNTENVHKFVDMISSNTQFLNRFQFQKWKGPDQSILQTIVPENSFIKKVAINFETMSLLKQGSSEEQILLKSMNNEKNVASYFGLLKQYEKMQKLNEKGPITLTSLQKASISLEAVEKLEKLRLIRFENGQVIFQ